MGEIKKLTESQRQEIVKMYAEGLQTKEIAESYGVDRSYVSQLANRRGYRRKSKQTPEAIIVGYGKTCPHCKEKNPQMAKFCMFCGGDVRDERQILIGKIESLRALLSLLPDSAQGEADEITRMVIKYLGGR